MMYRIELAGHGKNTRVYADDDEITMKIDLIVLSVPCDDRPTLTLRGPFDDFDDREVEIEIGKLEIFSHEPGEV